MTIEEVEELRVQELNNTLRIPQLEIDINEVDRVFLIQRDIHALVNDETFFNTRKRPRTCNIMSFSICFIS